MFKEKCEKVKTFVKDHKYEIILGTGLVITGITIKYCKKDIVDLVKIAMDSLLREERRIEFELKELYESIERLDKDAPINKFDIIPERLARMEELEMDLILVRKAISKVTSK